MSPTRQACAALVRHAPRTPGVIPSLLPLRFTSVLLPVALCMPRRLWRSCGRPRPSRQAVKQALCQLASINGNLAKRGFFPAFCRRFFLLMRTPTRRPEIACFSPFWESARDESR